MNSASSFRNAGAWARRNFWWGVPAVIFAGVTAYIIIYIAPWSNSTADEPSDIPSAWNRGVGQLGISPLYPPQEDFFVGDIWAVIVDSPDPATAGRGVRVGHIDLSNAIKSEGGRAPAFLKGANNAASPYIFSLAFPGISIYHDATNSGKSWSSILSINASRTNKLSDQINIIGAQTYGADLSEALIKFYDYCGALDTKIRCSDKFIRRILATTIDEYIDKPPTKRMPKLQIRLHLITRVYLTSGITHRRVVAGTVSFAGSAQSPGSTSGGSDDKKVLPTGEVTRNIGDKSEMSFEEKFTTPLVFGFRSAVFVPT